MKKLLLLLTMSLGMGSLATASEFTIYSAPVQLLPDGFSTYSTLCQQSGGNCSSNTDPVFTMDVTLYDMFTTPPANNSIVYDCTDMFIAQLMLIPGIAPYLQAAYIAPTYCILAPGVSYHVGSNGTLVVY